MSSFPGFELSNSANGVLASSSISFSVKNFIGSLANLIWNDISNCNQSLTDMDVKLNVDAFEFKKFATDLFGGVDARAVLFLKDIITIPFFHTRDKAVFGDGGWSCHGVGLDIALGRCTDGKAPAASFRGYTLIALDLHSGDTCEMERRADHLPSPQLRLHCALHCDDVRNETLT